MGATTRVEGREVLITLRRQSEFALRHGTGNPGDTATSRTGQERLGVFRSGPLLGVTDSAVPNLPNPMPTDSSHEKIARRAYQMWQAAGCPDGTHDEHWFDAERELARRADGEPRDQNPAVGHEKHPPISPAVAAHQQTIQAEVQKQAARSPQTPATHAPKPKPAPTGKPVWDKPHSA